MDTVSKIKPEPRVSVLMLTYNRASYIAEAITSVLNQVYQNLELVIIDDGSTDSTCDIVSSFNDTRIKYIRHEENVGLIERRKESLSYANGSYVAILDSDDIWNDPTKLVKQVSFLESNHHCVLVGTFILLIDQSGAPIGKNPYAITDHAIRNRILARNQFAHSSVVIRNEALLKTAGYQDTGLAEDLDLFLQLGSVGGFANLPEYLTRYRIHTQSFNSKRLEMSKAVLEIVKKYSRQYPRAMIAILKCYVRIALHTVLKFGK